MKRLPLLLILLFVMKVMFAQTLEHQFNTDYCQIYQVSENEYVYGFIDYTTNLFNIYSLDYSLIETIDITPDSGFIAGVINLSRTLFNSDSKFEVLYSWSTIHSFGIKIRNEDDTEIFSLDTGWGVFFFNTNQGSKMVVQLVEGQHKFNIYALYGTILNTDKTDLYSENIVYPNPSTDKINISAKIPENEDNLILSIFTTGGRLVDQINVSSKDKPIQIDVSKLQPGLYMYRIHNESFSTQTDKFIISK